MVRLVVVVALLSITTAAASAQTRRPITQADSGKTFRVARGEAVSLRLHGPWVWKEPRLGSRAVRLTPIYYFAYPGFQEWTVKAQRLGRATVTSVGNKSGATRQFRVTIVVTKAGA